MKSSAIVKKALHKAYGVLYPTVGRKDKVVITISSCNIMQWKFFFSSFFCPPNFFEQSCFF